MLVHSIFYAEKYTRLAWEKILSYYISLAGSILIFNLLFFFFFKKREKTPKSKEKLKTAKEKGQSKLKKKKSPNAQIRNGQTLITDLPDLKFLKEKIL